MTPSTAPSDDVMEDPDPGPQGEAQKMALGQAKSYDTFHRYLHLPFELRAPIRAFAIEIAIHRREWRNSGGIRVALTCARLASVSKEWQGDVEKALFSKIRVDPLKEEEILEFEQYFTERRKKYLTQLEVAVDDNDTTGLWERSTGLLDISEFMAKTGQLFQQLSGWDFSVDGHTQRSIALMFVSNDWYPPTHPGRWQNPGVATSSPSLWDSNGLSSVTRNKVPTDVALWAIKSEFPSSLTMVTHFSFVPDCFPIAAAKRIIQAMPNLESCVFETRFECHVEEGWTDLTDFIEQLRVSAPSLRTLLLHSECAVLSGGDKIPASMAVFANALRDLSQRLEHLQAAAFEIHEAFFAPFSDKADSDAAASVCHHAWPKLKHLHLDGFVELPSSGPGRATMESTDICVAAAKATLAMPNLKSMCLTTPRLDTFEYVSSGHFCKSWVCLEGFNEDEERLILAASAHLVGAQAKLVREDKRYSSPTRYFQTQTGMVEACLPEEAQRPSSNRL